MWTARLTGCKRVHGLHVAPDGRLFVVGGPDARVVNNATWLVPGLTAESIATSLVATCYAIAPNLSRLVYAAGELGPVGSVALGAEPRRLRLFPDWLTDGVQWLAVAFAPDGRRLAVLEHRWPPRGRTTNTLVLRDAETFAVLAASVDLDMAYGAVTFSADGRRMAVTGGREFLKPVREFDAGAGTPTAVYDPPATGGTQAALYSPCGRWLVALNGRVVYRFPTGGGDPAPLKGHAKKLTAAAFAPDGRLLTAGLDGVVRTWDVDAGREAMAFAPGVGPLTVVAVAPDGLTAAAAGRNVVVVWDV